MKANCGDLECSRWRVRYRTAVRTQPEVKIRGLGLAGYYFCLPVAGSLLLFHSGACSLHNTTRFNSRPQQHNSFPPSILDTFVKMAAKKVAQAAVKAETKKKVSKSTV